MHQRDVNRLCIGFRATLGKRLLWFAAIDRPCPNRVNGIAMPQPDFVLVVAGDRGPELVFGEHDRGSESLTHFREAKVERYAELASLPSFCQDIFGFATFRVLITVMDPIHRRPHHRIAMLNELVRAAGRAELFDIHLAGKVHTHPGVVWEQSHVPHVAAS